MKSNSSNTKRLVLVFLPRPKETDHVWYNIFKDYQKFWRKNGNDPKNLHIAFLGEIGADYAIGPYVKTFSNFPIGPQDTIEIIGHSAPGEPGIYGEINSNSGKRTCFHYDMIAYGIKSGLVEANQIENHQITDEKIKRTSQTVQIILSSCFTGLATKKLITQNTTSPSGVQQLHEELAKLRIASHVIGYNGILLPSSKKNSKQFFLPQRFIDSNAYEKDFHKRIFMLPYFRGNFCSNPSLFFPRTLNPEQHESIACFDPCSTVNNPKTKIFLGGTPAYEALLKQNKEYDNILRDNIDGLSTRIQADAENPDYKEWQDTIQFIQKEMKNLNPSPTFIQSLDSDLEAIYCGLNDRHTPLICLPLLKQCCDALRTYDSESQKTKVNNIMNDLAQNNKPFTELQKAILEIQGNDKKLTQKNTEEETKTQTLSL